MATKKFTLLELHLGDGTVQIGPATIGAEGTPADAADDAGESAADDAAESAADDAGGRCPGRTAGKLLVLVLVLAVAAVAARKLLGGDEGLEELEDLADLDEE